MALLAMLPRVILSIASSQKALWLTVLASILLIYSLSRTSAYTDLASTAFATTSAFRHSLDKLPSQPRPLVLYAYAESDASRENLAFFVQKGLHGAADFVFIFNGATNATDLVPKLDNVRVVERDNTCYDLGAFGEVLRKDELWKQYKRFILMNASVRGPFFPNYMRPCWTDVFLGRLNDRVKLVGTTINCFPRPHLQSMVLATDDIGISILLDPALATSLKVKDKWGGEDDPVGLSSCYIDRSGAVHAEIGTTGLIRAQGYEIDVMMSSFSVDDEDLPTYCSSYKNREDPLVDNRYFGTNTHPYEMVFMKTNRKVAVRTMQIMTKLHLSRKWTSWDACPVH